MSNPNRLFVQSPGSGKQALISLSFAPGPARGSSLLGILGTSGLWTCAVSYAKEQICGIRGSVGERQVPTATSWDLEVDVGGTGQPAS